MMPRHRFSTAAGSRALAYLVHTIDADGINESAGISIFSKLPFAPISNAYEIAGYTNKNFTIGYAGQVTECGPGGPVPPTVCTEYVAFNQYDRSQGDDSFANKGVGHVRVYNTETERNHNVFFTHLQATYADNHEVGTWDGWYERETQMAEIKFFIELGESGSANPIDRNEQDIFVLGDLNIDGDFSNARDAFVWPYTDNLYEWTRTFRKGVADLHGDFFWQVLHDTWQYEHPIFDTFPAADVDTEYGYTADLGGSYGSRLDYILSSTPVATEPLCNQHPQIARNLLSGAPLVVGHGANPPGGRGQLGDGKSGVTASTFASDHLGVNAHYNKLAERCSPLLESSAQQVYGQDYYGAYPLSAEEVGNDPTEPELNNPGVPGKTIPGKLEYPGSVQWYYLDAEGSYLVGVDDDSYDLGYWVQVYRADNLSIPLKAYGSKVYRQQLFNGEGYTWVTGAKFDLEEGPYYIKVYHPEHKHRELPNNSTGNYILGVNRLGCTDKDADACPLYPNTKKSFAFPVGYLQATPQLDSMYFELAVESLTVPAEQEVRFDVVEYDYDIFESALVEDSMTSDGVLVLNGVELLNSGGPGVGAASDGTCVAGAYGFYGCNNHIEADFPNPSGPSQRYVWRVRRLDRHRR